MREFVVIRPGVRPIVVGAGMGAVLSVWNIIGMYTAIRVDTWDVWRQVLFVLAPCWHVYRGLANRSGPASVGVNLRLGGPHGSRLWHDSDLRLRSEYEDRHKSDSAGARIHP